MTTLLEPVELRAKGFDALVQSLGWVNAVRFIQQFEKSAFNYTVERDLLLPSLTSEELIRQLELITK